MEKENKKTKILAIGDLHGDSGLAKKIAKKAKEEKVDLIIIPGDLTWLEQPAKDIIKPFQKLNKKILILPGNHETLPTIESFVNAYSNVKNMHGNFFKHKNTGFFGAGYSTNTGPFWIEENEMFDLLKKSHDKIRDSKQKVMITHMHPLGSQSEFSGWEGSSSIKKAIKRFKPQIVINGHIHEAGGIQENFYGTKIINVARKPAIFEI
jgi:Icc-related predicted phosphoesterase